MTTISDTDHEPKSMPARGGAPRSWGHELDRSRGTRGPWGKGGVGATGCGGGAVTSTLACSRNKSPSPGSRGLCVKSLGSRGPSTASVGAPSCARTTNGGVRVSFDGSMPAAHARARTTVPESAGVSSSGVVYSGDASVGAVPSRVYRTSCVNRPSASEIPDATTVTERS